MTARKSGSRLETEIERCRSECQWDKIPELVRQLSAKLISNGKKHLTFLPGPSFNLEGLSPGVSPRYFLTATAGTGSCFYLYCRINVALTGFVRFIYCIFK